MAKYLINPIYAYKEIKENFILYVKTAFGTRYDSIEKEREELLNTDSIASREPWIEPLPSYNNIERNGEKLRISSLEESDLPGMNIEARSLFKEFILKGLISGNYPIYQHQAEMLQKALLGKNCIITSGTGSGKTESFLLPMLADIMKEAESGQLLRIILHMSGGRLITENHLAKMRYLFFLKGQFKEHQVE